MIAPPCTCTETGEDACPIHGIDASLKRQDESWRSVGGHPSPDQNDAHRDAADEADDA